MIPDEQFVWESYKDLYRRAEHGRLVQSVLDNRPRRPRPVLTVKLVMKYGWQILLGLFIALAFAVLLNYYTGLQTTELSPWEYYEPGFGEIR
jgi:hypothetical protein